MRLKNFVIVVEDLERSVKFYRDLFGLQKVREFEGNVVLTDGLVLQERSPWVQAIGRDVTCRGNDVALYFETPSLDSFMKKVWDSAWAVEFVHPFETVPGERRLMRVYDPDGHVIEVSEPWNSEVNGVSEEEPLADDTCSADFEEPAFKRPAAIGVGDLVDFGRYWFSDSLYGGKQAVSWRVLDKKDGKLLLFSLWGLDVRPYHDRDEAVDWEHCELRSWLNGSFLDSLVKWDERRLIKEVCEGEKVFVLNNQETCDYYWTINDGWMTGDRWTYGTMATPYAIARGAAGDVERETGTKWFLRKDEASETVMYVTEDGYDGGEVPVTQEGLAVRPAMWVDEAVVDKITGYQPYEAYDFEDDLDEDE